MSTATTKPDPHDEDDDSRDFAIDVVHTDDAWRPDRPGLPVEFERLDGALVEGLTRSEADELAAELNAVLLKREHRGKWFAACR